MKMLMFDFRDSEKDFFKTHEFKDIDIEFIAEPLNEMTQLTDEQLTDTDIVSVFITSGITQKVIDKFKNLRVIATRSTGYNHIDIKSCVENNIAVFNVEDYGQTSVAQYTIMLFLALVRKLMPAYIDMQRKLVQHQNYEGRDLNNLSLGIIGCGAIGGAVAKLAHAFGMTIYAYSYTKNPEVNDIVEYVSLNELYEKSDIISLHVPYTKDNYHMLNADAFSRMKKGVYIINTARGELIDIVSLYESLLSGHVAAAALDVLECEYLALSPDSVLEDIKDDNVPCINSALIAQKLLAMNNVIITPHIAYNTQESVNRLLEVTFNNIRDYSKGMHTNQVC